MVDKNEIATDIVKSVISGATNFFMIEKRKM
jgi:hypothetical protein